MSYDFELYSTKTLVLVPPVTAEGSNIRVDGPDRVEDEDIPDNYLAVVGKKRVLHRIHLEGDLSASDQAAVNDWLSLAIAKTKGVLIDQQTDRFEASNKSGQLKAHTSLSSKSGWMSFYYEKGEDFYEFGFENMLRLIAAEMPEAVPTRYGYYEPMQGCVENGDLSELISSFKIDPDVFLKAKTPFGHIFIRVPCKKTFERYHPKHFMRRKFLLGCASFEIRPKLFEHPANFNRLLALFKELCVTLDVAYASIMQSDDMGSWLWYGLPDKPAHTICVGNAYQSVWPDLQEIGEKIGTHHHFVTTDRFGNKPPSPPRELIAPKQRDTSSGAMPDYAAVFPFNYEFDHNRYIW